MVEIKTSIGSINIRNPLILASGLFATSYSTINRAYKEGFGAVVTKSIGIKSRKGYRNPSIIYLAEIQSLLNAVGLANPGYLNFINDLKNVNSDVKVILSLFGSSSQEFTSMIKEIDNSALFNPPIAYELNLSCPHAEKVGMTIGTDPDMVYTVVKTAKDSTKVPIWVKLTPNITDIVMIAESAIKAGADALVAINTLKAMKIDISVKKPVLANIFGGLSGSAIKPVGVRIIYELYEKFGIKLPLIGVGGIWTWEDVIEYILAGANAVQVGSALTRFNTPARLVNNLLQGVEQYIEKEGLEIGELRGLAHE